MLLLIGCLLLACGGPIPSPTPTASTVVDCQLETARDCDMALDAASAFLRDKGLGIPAREIVVWGRAMTWHAEIHACFADGRYLLIDAIGPLAGPPSASLRSPNEADPPCR